MSQAPDPNATEAPRSLETIFRALSDLGGAELERIGPLPFLAVLALSLICAFFVAFLYRQFYSNRETGTQIHRAFPLLGLSITAIFICIQFSLPLSLGLLGALSIVRFRTPVKEPEEIGFLMVVIATSLACATFNFVFLVVILGLTLGAVLLQELAFTQLGSSGRHGMVMLAFPQGVFEDHREELLQALGEAMPKGRFESLSKSGDDVVVAYSFRSLKAKRLPEIQSRIQAVAEPASFSISYKTNGSV